MSLAQNLFTYYTTWGIYDEIITDPLSDILSDAVITLNKWLGIRHVISLVGRHQSNGVEGTNKQILRHLRTLVHDERSLKYWSQPQYYKMIEYYVNSFDNSETGVTPLHARFGSDA